MYEDLEAILKEISGFDLVGLLASLNEPPLEVLLEDLQESTEAILKEFGVL